MQPRYDRNPHLVDLVAQAERLASLVPDEVDTAALDMAAVASVRLDGSSLRDVPTPPGRPADAGADAEGLAERRVDDLEPWEREPSDDEVSLWVDPMGYVHRSDRHVEALEYVGVRSALEADDLGANLLVDPVPSLTELHRRLTRGLVDADVAGEPRITHQVVHDSSVGKILFYPADPSQIPGRLAALGAWLVSDGAKEHALITSGILHHELLAVHPFEAANGRLARTASRLVLRSRGLDPGGRCGVESELAADPLGYLEEVARTVRRRDHTIWLERWGEAVVAALRAAARRAGALDTPVPDAARAWLATSAPDRFTVADFREAVVADPEVSRHQLSVLLDHGLIGLIPGTRGLRYRRTTTDAPND